MHGAAYWIVPLFAHSFGMIIPHGIRPAINSDFVVGAEFTDPDSFNADRGFPTDGTEIKQDSSLKSLTAITVPCLLKLGTVVGSFSKTLQMLGNTRSKLL